MLVHRHNERVFREPLHDAARANEVLQPALGARGIDELRRRAWHIHDVVILDDAVAQRDDALLGIAGRFDHLRAVPLADGPDFVEGELHLLQRVLHAALGEDVVRPQHLLLGLRGDGDEASDRARRSGGHIR
jgi:hypothetical protein